MRARWVLCPMVTLSKTDADTGATWSYRAPKVAAYLDPTRGKPYQFVALAGETHALALVKGGDFGPLAADPEVLDLFETDSASYGARDILRRTPAQLLWPASKRARLAARWALAGVSVADLSPVRLTPREVLRRLAKAIGAEGDPDEVAL